MNTHSTKACFEQLHGIATVLIHENDQFVSRMNKLFLGLSAFQAFVSLANYFSYFASLIYGASIFIFFYIYAYPLGASSSTLRITELHHILHRLSSKIETLEGEIEILRQATKTKDGVPLEGVQKEEVEVQAFDSVVDGWVIKTEEELCCVVELRDRLEDVAELCTYDDLNLSDSSLVRFCRARKLKLDKAEMLYRNALNWRLSFKPREFMKKYSKPPVLRDYYVSGWTGTHAKDGTVIYIERLGLLDPHGIVKSLETAEQAFQELAVHVEETHTKRMIAASTNEKEQYQLTVILDLKGLSTRHLYRPALKLIKVRAQIDDDYYPERARVVFLINVPRVFYAIWAIAKHFFDPTTREKMRIVQGNGMKDLLEVIDKDQLPAFLGGNFKVDNDDECTSFIGKGGIVPSTYFCRKSR